MHKVIFHVSEVNSWQRTLGNVKNLVNEFLRLKEDYHIIILANGSAVQDYQNDEIISRILSYDEGLVTFKACNNALNANKINPSDLNIKIEVVPAGVYELTVKQKAGYSYIKS